MKNTSATYKEQFDRQERNRSYVRVVFQQIDVGAAQDGMSEDNGHLPYSEWATPDADYEHTSTYATFEPDRWRLDGTQKLLPDAPPYEPEGYVGDEISGADGAFTVNPLITREFSQKHSIIGLTITFDAVLGDAIEHFIVRFYNDNAQVDMVEIEGNAASRIVIERTVPVLDKYTVECIKTRNPFRRARIQRVLHGVEKIFDNDRIEFTEQVSDVDPISRRLPTETMQFTIFDYEKEYDPDNPESVWEYIDIQSPISIRHGYKLDDGRIEWLAPDRYLLDGRPEIGENRATFKATKLTGYMTDTYFKGKTGLQSLYSLAEAVLLDADLPLTPSLENAWWIDPGLNNIYTRAALPIDTHKNCLQMIAHAGRCRLYTDGNGVIRLEKMELPSNPASATINYDIAMAVPVITKIEPLYSINVLKYTDSVDATATELHKSTFSVTGTTEFYAEFSPAEELNVAITGGTLSNVKKYTRAVTATITATGNVTITITGKQINTSASGAPLVVSTDNRGETEIVENPLVTENEVKTALEQHIAAYLALRNAYSFPYRGRPDLETGDLIDLQSQFTPSFPAILLRHVISFNGGLRGEGIFKRVN